MKSLFLILSLLVWAIPKVHYCQTIIWMEDEQGKNSMTQTFAPDLLLKAEIASLRSSGHLAAGIDSLKIHQDTLKVYFHKGPILRWEKVQWSIPDELKWAHSDFSEKLDSAELSKALEITLFDLENSGHPFASIRVNTRVNSNNEIEAELTLNPGPLVYLDSIIFKSLEPVPTRFIQSLLGLKPKQLYNEKQLKNIPVKFNQVSFLTLSEPPQIQFFEEGARLYLYVKNKPANQFDGVLGFQPEEGSAQASITGSLDLKLRNVLRAGESIDFNWRRLQNQTQNLKAGMSYPFLLSTNLGLGGSVDLYRRDTTFSTTALRGALHYLFSLDQFAEVFVENWNSNGLNSLSGSIEDVKLTRYGLGWTSKIWDNFIDPRKGCQAHIEASAANKQQADNEAGTLRSAQYAGLFNLYQLNPLGKSWSIGLRLQGATKLDSLLFLNELYRIGGFKSLRGFNEESLFASTFLIGGLEARYHLGSGVSIMGFVDQAWYEQKLEGYYRDTPLGVGIGLNLNTKNGAFSLLYGLGKTSTSTFLIREGKVHFGFINLF